MCYFTTLNLLLVLSTMCNMSLHISHVHCALWRLLSCTCSRTQTGLSLGLFWLNAVHCLVTFDIQLKIKKYSYIHLSYFSSNTLFPV